MALVVSLIFAGSAHAQTFQVGGDSAAKPAAQPAAQPGAQQPVDPAAQLGWGSNIQSDRLARAAQLALQKGDKTLAVDYATRAAKSAPNNPELWFLLGYAARLDGKYGPSADAFKRGLKLKSGSVEGLSGLAQTYSFMGRTDEAETILKQVIASDPSRRIDLLVLGELYTRAGDYTGALEWLNKAEHIQPDAQSELLLAASYEHLKQMDQASHYLEMAKSRAPNNPDVDRSLAQFYRETGDYPKAIAALLAIHNPRPDVLAELAYTYELAGNVEESARLYVQAANALPRDLGLQLSAAQAQIAYGSIDRAMPLLERAAKLDPGYYRLHAIRGEIAQIQDQDEQAAKEYSAAIAAVPASPVEGPLYVIQLHMNLEGLYKGLDEKDLAQQQLQTAQTEIGALDEKGSDRPAFLRLRALIHMNADQLDSALADMNESLALTPHDPNSLQLDGDLLMRMDRTSDAIAVYKQVLAIDPKSRFALTSLGYASRAAGDDAGAERYFKQLAHDYPTSYVPYLALGDMDTARAQYAEAEASYQHGYTLAPKNALIIAGGINAAIESHHLALAGTWLGRITTKMDNVPQVMREQERYYSLKGDEQRSAAIGRKVIQMTPHDRDVVVYLGYDLLKLEQYPELLALTNKYMEVFPREPDIPLLQGYVYKHDGLREQAIKAFSTALDRDPTLVTAYTNRGFVYNDMRQPAKAALDFEQALKREPKDVEAHTGLAYAELNQGHGQAAIRQTQMVEELAGDSKLIHVIRATAYGREGLLSRSAAEYNAALKFDPTDGSIYLGLANIYYAERRYHEALAELVSADKLLPNNALVYALMARTNANLQNRDLALHDIQLAEQFAQQKPASAADDESQHNTLSDIYVSTGEAFTTLGDQKSAMDRFSKALLTPESNRVAVRLAIAGLMVQQNQNADAERQIALAQLEVDAGDTAAPTGEQYIQAAGILQQMHEYQLSETYLDRAAAAGAPNSAVRIALANSYLALGETRRAAAELAAVKQSNDGEQDYQYLLAQAAVAQQEHQGPAALSAFAAAASDAGDDQTAEQQLLQAGANEGFRVTPRLSILSNLIVEPIFEDSTVYVLDSKLDSPAPVAPTNLSQLPPPRSSIQTDWINAFHLHFNHLPTNSGYFELRNARGNISVPAISTIVQRNTTDYAVNFALDPTVHIGSNSITFNSGVQGTLRRDSLSPIEINQNLFRAFTYFTSTSFFSAVSVDGFFSYEFGPFTQLPINGKTFIGGLNFRVGTPWAKTALVTGWGLNDQRFSSQSLGYNEDYFTSSYIGLTHRFSPRISAEGIVEDVRAYRITAFHNGPVTSENNAISQGLRPAGTFGFSPTTHWDIQATTSYESTRGFHVYDLLQNGFAVSYTRPLDRTFNDKTGKIRLRYPIRLAAGMQEETFLNFNYGSNQSFRPYFSLTIF